MLSKHFGPGALRLVLALMVVISHSSTISVGFFAVCAFFVLSGYWISIMWREKYSHLPFPYPTFIASRYFRLLPCLASAAAIALAAVACFGIGDTLDYIGPIRYSIATLLTHFTIVGLCLGHLIVRPAWSLDIEMQFYFIAPLLILFLKRIPSPLGAIVTCAGFTLWHFLNLYFDWIPITLLPSFLLFFSIGILIDQLSFRPKRSFAIVSFSLLAAFGMACLVIPMMRPLLIRMPGYDSDTLGHWTAPALCIAAIPLIGFILALPSSRLDRHFGNLAYPMYLLHVIPIGIANTFKTTTSQIREMPLTISSVLAAGILTVVVYSLVDIPCERYRHIWLKRLAIK